MARERAFPGWVQTSRERPFDGSLQGVLGLLCLHVHNLFGGVVCPQMRISEQTSRMMAYSRTGDCTTAMRQKGVSDEERSSF
jgi:hypothetical protein